MSTITQGRETAPDEALIRHYTPEELVDPNGPFRLPTTARMLREAAYARRIPFSRWGGRITFRIEHVRAFGEQFDVQPLSIKKPRRAG
ncbi:hypothetical protein [Streptomyces sp. NPDC001985]|uniref:hypothetical protein n=1 Tax=Streptomyces sp. NPDC001985 TaxID=3154406 RepID=UPI0033213031